MAWLNSEITWAANEGSEALLEIIGQKAERFNAINVATALHRLARCHGDGNKELAEHEAYEILWVHGRPGMGWLYIVRQNQNM